MQAKAIETEIDELWAECFADAQRTPISRGEWKEAQSELLEANKSKALEGLQPWLAIFEFGLDWLGQVHLALNNENGIGPRSPGFRVPWALVGASSAFGWEIRNACVAGFDTPARALLRTFVESLFLCLAVLYDKPLGEAYQRAESDEQVVDFWHTHASPKSLHKRIIKIEESVGFSDDLIADLTEYRRREYEVMSQSSHLSYLAASMTCLPATIEDEGIFQVGIFGRTSASSHRTLSYGAMTAWYFSRLAVNKIIGSDNSDNALLTLDKEDENHQAIVIGRDVLSTIVLRHWDA